MSDPVVLLSTGDVVGPAGGVTDNSMVLFSGTSGKLIKGNNAVVTAQGLALLDDVNAAAQRVTLGLGNVDNTSDVNKPISTATQTALDLKAPLASPLFTGVPSAPTAAAGTNTTQLANTAFVKAAVDNAPRVGVGQTWQDVGASRVVNVTYTNSTGRPIMVFAGSGTTISSAKSWVINGLPGIMFNNSGTQTGTSGAISAIIPAGDTYLMYSSNGNHGGWWELR